MIRIQITYFSLLTCFLTLGLTISACSQSREWVPGDTEFYEPVPPIVEAKPVFMQPPSDATILFDGSDLSAWESTNGGAADWTLENGAMTVKPGSGKIVTNEKSGSVQLYLEWRAPVVVCAEMLGRGNSGALLRPRAAVQELELWKNETYSTEV